MSKEKEKPEEVVEAPEKTVEVSEEEEFEGQLKSVLDELEELRKENEQLKARAESSEKKADSQKERLRKLVLGISTDKNTTHSDINNEPQSKPVSLPEDYFTKPLEWD